MNPYHEITTWVESGMLQMISMKRSPWIYLEHLKKGQSEIAFGGQRVEGVVRLLRFNSGIWKQAAATAFNGSCKKLFLYRTVRYVFKWKFQRYSGDEKAGKGMETGRRSALCS